MSSYLITRCPNCQTSFRVTDEHLAAYKGKVRCGRCAFVFQATENLLTAAAAEAPPPRKETVEQVAEAVLPGKSLPESQSGPLNPTDNPTQERVEESPEADPLGLDIDQPEPLPEHFLQSPATAEGDVLVQLEQQARAAQDEPSLTGDSLNQLVEELHQRVKAEEREREAAAESPEAATPTQPVYRPILTPEDEALLQVKPKPSPLRWLWLLPILLGVLVLVLQITVHYRTVLAVALPGLRPQLEWVSAQFGETVPLPREASYLRTEWSELTLVPGFDHLVQVNATLRNHAPFEQDLPYLELSLSDENDKVVARKVFTPQQYLPKGDKLTLLHPRGDMRVYLQLDLGQLKTTGYAINWFYP